VTTQTAVEEPAEQTGVVTVEEVDSGAPPSLSKRFFNIRTLLSFGVGFALLAFLFTRVQIDVGAIFDRVRQANVFLLLLALIVFYTTFPIRSVRWRRLLNNAELTSHEHSEAPGEGGNGHHMGTPALTEIMFLAWFANCIVPAKLGDVYRAYLLKINARVSFSTTIGTILAERIIDVIVLFALMLAATWLSFGRAIPQEVLLLMQIGLVALVVVVIVLFSMRRLRPLVQRVLPRRLHAQYAKLEHGTLRSFRGIPALVGLSTLAWAAETGRLYLVTASLGLATIAPSVIVFVALAAALMTTLPLTPAGLGFAEGAIVGVLLLAAKAGLAPGVDEHAAASIALLDRSISYWSIVLLGLIVYPLSRKK
jgi:uncharacterized protein (TIRG00374 family)